MNGLFLINGTEVEIDFPSDATLVQLLRAHGYTEVKQGCSHGECGSCIILLEGNPVNACQIYAATVTGRKITTGTGLSEFASWSAVKNAMIRRGAVQCGFCTPGVMASAVALLEHTPEPTVSEIAAALTGNLCRCTGYVKIVQAIKDAASEGEQ